MPANVKVIDGVIELTEFDADSLGTPSTDKVFLYVEDDGAGTTLIKLKRSDGVEIGFVRTNPDSIAFNIDAIAGDYLEGTLRWNATDHCLEFDTGLDGVTIQIGQEVVKKCRNTTGSTILNGKIVRIEGSTGNRPDIVLAQANIAANCEGTIGVTTQDIENNTDGFVTLIGTVRGLNTSGIDEGSKIYLSADTAGEFTTVESAIIVEIGTVTTSNPAVGTIDVHVNSFIHLYKFASNPTGTSGFSKSAWQSALEIGGSAAPTFVESANYTVLPSDFKIICKEDVVGSDIYLNFPSALEASGVSRSVVKVGQYQTHITGANFLIGEEITDSITLTRNGEAPSFYSDGTYHYLI